MILLQKKWSIILVVSDESIFFLYGGSIEIAEWLVFALSDPVAPGSMAVISNFFDYLEI